MKRCVRQESMQSISSSKIFYQIHYPLTSYTPGDGHRVDHLLRKRRLQHGHLRALALPRGSLDGRLRPQNRNLRR